MSRTDLRSLDALREEIARDGFSKAWRSNFEWFARTYGDQEKSDLSAILVDLLKADPIVAQTLVGKGKTKGAATSSRGVMPPCGHATFREQTAQHLASAGKTIAGVVEADGSLVKFLPNLEFENWGRTVQNRPAETAVPTTKVGIRNIVKWAKANGKSVRAAGYRHTWGDLYSDTGEVLISMLPLEVVEDLPAQHPKMDPSNQLQGIEVVGTVNECGVEKALCRIGAATTNYQFRRWCLSRLPGGGNYKWTVPLNVIMVEITWGGSNAPICHGAGRRNETLSDLVTEIEFVNANGDLQTVTDPTLLKAASGAFGLMGIVTSITLKLDPMSFAKLEPINQRLGLAIPPPDGFPVPKGVDMSGITPAHKEIARQKFERQAEDAYYAEWFWFTMQPDVWVNVWNNDGEEGHSVDYPSHAQAYIQGVLEYFTGLLVESDFYNELPEYVQALILGGGAMATLPNNTTITTPLIDALHFQRGIQNMRVYDMEWEIPIPARADDPTKPDWSVCQRAWWQGIQAVYGAFDDSGKVPMRLTMEMRIMGGSSVTMAPQNGNNFGTCSIEILTTINTDREDWSSFMQRVTDAWTSITDGAGKRLNIRPHWAKEWQGLTIKRGSDVIPINDYLRDDAYRQRLPEFATAMQAIAATGGCTMADLKARFGNPTLTKIFKQIYRSEPMQNTNAIKITAADNELYVIAIGGPDSSYELCHIQSGFNYTVDVTINILSEDIENGETYKRPNIIDGLAGNLLDEYKIFLPNGPYVLIFIAIDWGGGRQAEISVLSNGVSNSYGTGPYNAGPSTAPQIFWTNNTAAITV